MSQAVTLRDVAELAGVSLGTASQALNNRPNVASETRTRVLDAAQTLGYQVRIATLPCPETDVSLLGMLVKHDYGLEVTVNPFYSHVQAGVERECRQRGINLMYANIEVDASNHPVLWPQLIREERLEGLILVGTFIEGAIDQLKRQINMPIVLVDSYAPHLPYDSVVTDNINGVEQVVEHLLARGHCKIGLIGANDHSPPSIRERREGYVRTLQAHGIGEHYIEPSQLSREDGEVATYRLLTRAPEVTAIIACNDETAIGVMHAAIARNLSVPADLSVVGFDNIDLARDVTPALTTVHVHKAWMGSLGVRTLLDRLQNPDQPRITVTVATQLIERNSVAAPRH
ncbi:MAG: LacI family DNA-binding transcriptional regulator [Caldilinea sp.]